MSSGRYLLMLALAVVAPQCGAQTAVAEVRLLQGSASAQLAGAEKRALALGAPIYLLDRVETAPRAVLRIEFRDRTTIALGGDAAMTITRYTAEATESSFLVEIARGTFRIVTGLFAKRARVFTPSNVIGIRGTNFGGETDGVRTVVVLLEPERGRPPGAIEVSNAAGAVTIDRPGFGTETADAQTAPTPPRRMRLRSVENLIRSVSTIQRAPAPRTPR